MPLAAMDAGRKFQSLPGKSRNMRLSATVRLILTAQTEYQIASPPSQRPQTAGSADKQALSEVVPLLLAAAKKEETTREDAFQAQICSAWVHLTLGDMGAALTTLPVDLSATLEDLSKGGNVMARWTHIGIVKGAYIRGVALENTGMMKEAAQCYESMLPHITSIQSTVGMLPEHRLWSERLLARYCMLVYKHVAALSRTPHALLADDSNIEPASIMKPYRAWAEFWDTRHPRTTNQHSGIDIENGSLRTRIWKAYYDILSVLVQHQIVSPVSESRPQQALELRSVEASYESMLLQEVKFPKADQATPEIEGWVDQVMANWRTLLGPSWKEADLGSGGRVALSRSVLDVIYRAATRSFHSSRVLRHLFTVHTALAEFLLAGKALDSYLEIATKGKARVEQSAEAEPGLDDDVTVLCTAAAGIIVLCTYGKRKEAERAQQIATVIETWLQKADTNKAPRPEGSVDDRPKTPDVNSRLAQAYHAIGISRACWARLTYETSSRAELQANAISNFRQALRWDLDDEDNIQTLYSLAFVLAETRDTDGAITAVKQAISIGTRSIAKGTDSRIELRSDSTHYTLGTDAHQRALLLRSWHLLVLLLSARQDFSTALASCEAAFEPYGGKAVLYAETLALDSILGLELRERVNLVELKMTHLALLEVLDGPEDSVNASGELLGLYAKLFKPIGRSEPRMINARTVSPTLNTYGTQRSLRGSILGLPKNHRKAKLASSDQEPSSLGSLDPLTEGDAGPAISGSIDGNRPLNQNPEEHQGFLGHHEANKLRKRPSRKSMASIQRSQANSPSRARTTDGDHHHHKSLHLPTRRRQHNQMTADGSGDPSPHANNSETMPYSVDEIGVAMTHDMPSVPGTPQATTDPLNPLHNIVSAAQNMNHKNPNPNPITPKPPASAVPSPQAIIISASATIPEPNYPSQMQDRHALTLLTKIWLFISSLYRHASMLADAHAAISEAKSQVEAVEQGIASHERSSAENFSSPGYGGLKSCGELWADVLAEQAALYLAEGKNDQALSALETALSNHLDHLPATVGLSSMLLDVYAASPQPDPVPNPTDPPNSIPILASLPKTTVRVVCRDDSTTPDLLLRLSARERAYGLLSALTKSGQGWDSSEAWFALARAYEDRGQTAKAKEAFWWVVTLEEGRAVRQWNCIL
ncbi:MAG: hypothetical protein Q9163_002598 [Psora crenata]